MKATTPPASPPPATQSGAGKPLYRLDLHRDVAADVQGFASQKAAFRPTLEALFAALETDPKQFPTKAGPLAGCRAAPVRYNRTTVWRCVYEIDEAARVVRILALGPHDAAYKSAARRV